VQHQLNIYIEGCLKNDPASQEALYKYCFAQFIKICMGYHAGKDDAVASFNKAMHKVFTGMHQYRNEGPVLGWIRKIIVNTCLNDLRGRARFSAVEIDDREINRFTAEPEIYAGLEVKQVMELVQQLPPATRIVFNLFIMEGFTHEQIAKQLGITAGTSKWHLNQARQLLKQGMEQLTRHENNLYAK
jgi:RNA polymerase sigma-70 factor, ECF subfamily